MHLIRSTPLIKVASDAKPYSKLQPTTLNGGGEGDVYFIEKTFISDSEVFSAVNYFALNWL